MKNPFKSIIDRIEYRLWGIKIGTFTHAGWLRRGLELSINGQHYRITRIKGNIVFAKWKKEGGKK